MKLNEQTVEDKLENLLNALIIYRDIETKALHRIQELLEEKGIRITEKELSKMDENAIREKLKETAEIRKKKEAAVAENKVSYKTVSEEKREEEFVCRR